VAHPTRARLPELYVKLINRTRLRTRMDELNLSQRDLAKAIGWASHSYLGRLIRGQVDTLDPDAALRIAYHLRLGVDELFAPRVSGDTQHIAQKQPAA
jgi:transcriptional regulator with XRE-family HTH domain